jgi:hypothetical protein
MRTAAARALNAICPYFTMYPLDFPLGILQKYGNEQEWVLDPFCGRGTTSYAARLCGMPSCGYDTSPVAVAIAAAKLVNTSASAVIRIAEEILSRPGRRAVPQSAFWHRAYHQTTLRQLCQVRTALLRSCDSPAEIMLRAIVLGALHGPLTKETPSHLSNQCPRTFAPKPDYALKFWRERGLRPPKVDLLDVVRQRAKRYLGVRVPRGQGLIKLGDSRRLRLGRPKYGWVITSPPYYGMRTYVPDQWLRYWFLGGSAEVTYGQRLGELTHQAPAVFASQLREVWSRAATVALPGARLVCRFGGIRDRHADPLDIIKTSFQESGWRLTTIRDAGDASTGKRQAAQFGVRIAAAPCPEYDVYAIRQARSI